MPNRFCPDCSGPIGEKYELVKVPSVVDIVTPLKGRFYYCPHCNHAFYYPE